jgi:hypothetical protein
MPLVRLNPRNPRAGNVLGTYSMFSGGRTSIRFTAGVWYSVSQEMATYLSKVRQRHGDPGSQLAFTVCATEADAQALVKRELEEEQRGKRPEDAIAMAQDFSTAQMPQPVASLSPEAARAAEREAEHERVRRAATATAAAASYNMPQPAPVGMEPQEPHVPEPEAPPKVAQPATTRTRARAKRKQRTR